MLGLLTNELTIHPKIELMLIFSLGVGWFFVFTARQWICQRSAMQHVKVFNKKMFHGYGFGVRYFTGFGPLRLDVGFPLAGRKKIDKAFQVYFGIGQNF